MCSVKSEDRSCPGEPWHINLPNVIRKHNLGTLQESHGVFWAAAGGARHRRWRKRLQIHQRQHHQKQQQQQQQQQQWAGCRPRLEQPGEEAAAPSVRHADGAAQGAHCRTEEARADPHHCDQAERRCSETLGCRNALVSALGWIENDSVILCRLGGVGMAGVGGFIGGVCISLVGILKQPWLLTEYFFFLFYLFA